MTSLACKPGLISLPANAQKLRIPFLDACCSSDAKRPGDDASCWYRRISAMICPYCVEDIPPQSTRHETCKKLKGEDFPPYYFDLHADEYAQAPVVLSVMGFGGHGKTVFLCALFHYLDHVLINLWPKFFNRRLDQKSLTTLQTHLDRLNQGILPARTDRIFPRPGIFRPTNMPKLNGTGTMPVLDDTTILIYDPPGEAFNTESEIVELAGFVKR